MQTSFITHRIFYNFVPFVIKVSIGFQLRKCS